MTPLPLLPTINLGLALVLSAIVVLLVGENPLRALIRRPPQLGHHPRPLQENGTR
jgi:ABC-type uncharacterized transport system permease subunit